MSQLRFYTGIGATLSHPVFLPPLMDTATLAGKRVLVVDDVADSGTTLALVMETVSRIGGPSQPPDARSAVLYTKPSSIVAPDFTWHLTDRWITFPWSALPPVSATVPQSEEGEAGAQQA